MYYCSALFVAAPGQRIVTTDLVGGPGYDATSYTTDFGGTSAATSIVSGVVALMLAENPSLTWRDVKHILARTSVKVDSWDPGWTTGTFHHNEKYGFGLVDAEAAVKLAATWTNMPPEASVPAISHTLNVTIPDNNLTGVTNAITVGSAYANFLVEHVEVVFDATHPYRGDLEITLTSPAGVVSRLATPRYWHAGNDFPAWRFGSVRHWGEKAAGTWTLRVADTEAQDVGTWHGWTLRIYGIEAPAAPGLLSPAGTITDSTPTYTWTAVAGASDYNLRVTDGSGTVRVSAWYTAAQAGCAGGTGTCRVTPTAALAPGCGKWWVRLRNDTGDGPWSNPRNFTLVAAASPTPPTARGQRRADGVTGIPLGGATPPPTVVFRGTVSDPAGQPVRLQVEVKRVGASFTGAVSCESGLVASGTAASCSANALAGGAYHWQTRTVDSTGLPSGWVSYAINPETEPDFVIDTAPAVPSGRGQRQADGVTPIPLGGTAQAATVVFRATVSDPDPGQTVRLQVEARPLGTAFTGAVHCQSALVSSGTAASCAVTGLTLRTGYHWRLRAVDSKGMPSAWAAYATNAETAADFVVTATLAPLRPTALAQRQADGVTPIPLGGTAGTTVVFAGTVPPAAPGETLRFQVEVRPVGLAFTGTPTCQSAPVAPGTAATCPASLAHAVSYHWRARAVDGAGTPGPWAAYGANPETAPDFWAYSEGS
jgi:subtilisin-like proprotein convertase family protein